MNVKKLYKNELSKSESSWKRIDTNRNKTFNMLYGGDTLYIRLPRFLADAARTAVSSTTKKKYKRWSARAERITFFDYYRLRAQSI